MQLNSKRWTVSDQYLSIQDLCWEKGWTDGLPVVPPTESSVLDMLSAMPGDHSVPLGRIEPSNSLVTLEKLAVNAVMAGCLPEYFPVVVASMKAALDQDFNLGGHAATTGGAAQVIIVNGTIAGRLGISGDAGCFGPGYRANATIGRALRLAVRNIGDLIPGVMDKATQSTPGRYSFCFAENEEQSPWEPHHVTLGFPEQASVVTLAGVRGVHNTIFTSGSGIKWEPGLEVLHGFVSNMKAGGISNYYQTGSGAQLIIVLCPEHAVEVSNAGFTKQDIQEYIFKEARMPISELVGNTHYGNHNWPDWVDEDDPDYLLPIVRSQEDIAVLVAGGEGRHSSWMAGWGVTRMKSEEITGI
ncbi:MAG: hypothetical protein CL759_04440 [Chloroflexi bacterium]|nr:hypothetical protein [Chloroflexota bacterium]